MTQAARLLAELGRAQVRVWEDGGQLRYHAPRGALTPELLQELRARKEEVLKFCRQAKPAGPAPEGPPPGEDTGPPLSLPQQRLWIIDRLDGSSPEYNISLALRLRGELDDEALRRSLGALVARHEMLRAAIQPRGDSAVHVICPWCETAFRVVELEGWPESARAGEARRQAEEEAARPFDLGRAPLVRFVLWHLDSRDHVLLMVLHHIVADGRSIDVLAEELGVFYGAHRAGREAAMPPLRARYGDFARRQRWRLEDGGLQGQLDHWARRLAGAPPLLELPTDRPRSRALGGRGATVRSALDAQITSRVRRLARQSGATPYMVLLAGLACLLGRHTGSEDIVVGCPATHRDSPELDGLVGFFVNTLAFRFDLSGDPTFRDVLARVRAVVADGFANQDAPFEKVVEAAGATFDPGLRPLVQFTAAMLDGRQAMPRLPGLDAQPFEIAVAARTDLSLEMYDRGSGFDLFWIYDVELFEAGTVVALARRFLLLLGAALSDPDAPAACLPLLDLDERGLLVEHWGAGAASTTADAGHCFVHRMFEAQAAQTPGAVAVTSESGELTYAELNARANRLAHKLIGWDVGPGALVGICAERSPELVVALLAVLKAGAAYVPLDPDLPPERLAAMTRDCQPPVLLMEPQLRQRVPGGAARVLELVPDPADTHAAGFGDPDRPLRGDDLAYVMYTSGSTGSPKGVMVPHRAIGNHMRWMQEEFSLGAHDAVLQKTPFGFDASVWEFFAPLMAGARLVLARPLAHADPAYLVRVIREERVTVLQMVPSLLRLLVEHPGFGACTSLRRVFAGGEVLTDDLARKAAVAGAEVCNLYGPTEATIDATFHRVSRPLRPGAVPIGRPVAGTRAYVLDARMQPVPAGIAGELYLGGDGLALGYLNRPDLTAERFVSDPFSDHLASRLYRTGDRARWSRDGVLEFLGRVDQQVKIRGVRVEPGEVEAVLGRHPAIEQAAIVAQENGSGGLALVAYVTTRTSGATPADLRAYLRERLPTYMVPAAFAVLPRLPLTPNGKVDRKSLPPQIVRPPGMPGATRGAEADGGGAANTPPRNGMETTLAAIWAGLLGLSEIGVHDDFFELGGDSILVLQAVGRANQAGLRLSPRQMIEHPTVAGLAAVANAGQPVEAESSLAGLVHPVPLTPIQYWFFEQDLPEPHHFNQSVLLECREPLDPALLVRCLQLLASHHDALRMRFRRADDGGWRQEVADPGEAVPVELIDVSGLALAQRNAAVAARAMESQVRLSLSGGLVRAAYFDGGAGHPGHLLLVVHHLVVDGVSWRILLEDLWTAYRQMQIGQPVQLPPKTTSVRRWAERLEEYARSDALLAEREFWLAPPDPMLLRLPVDWTEGENNRGSVRHVAVELPEDETRALLQEMPSVYRTRINDVLLTALTLALRRWTGRGTLCVDLEGHGREDLFPEIDLSRTVGWFTTLAPVLLRLDTGEGCGAALLRVKEQLRGIPNGGLGYVALRYLSGDAALARLLRESPQAELCFNYLGQLDRLWPDSAPFRPSSLYAGPQVHPNGRRRYLIEVDGEVAAGRLRMRWHYSANRHRAETMEAVAAGFLAALRELIDHCRQPEAGAASASDFPLARFDRDQFSKVAKLLAAAKPRSVAP